MASERIDDRVAGLAAVVTRRRKELDLLQAELANLAGCSERFVHTVEHGKQTLRLDKLLDVLEVLGLGLLVAPGSGSVTVPEAQGVGEER